MVTQKEILQYYASDLFNPILPRDHSRRHFRFKQFNGYTWRKVPFKVRNTDDFKLWIQKLGGTDLYYSTSQWLNPEKISTKGTSGMYMVADNLLFSNDLVFDIDAEEPITQATLELARKSTWNLHQGMLDFKDRFKLEYVAFTGYKGFRLSYIDKQALPQDSRARLEFIEKDRKVFIQALLKTIKDNRSRRQIYNIDTFFDQKITENPLCVVRILGTVHSTTGFISCQIPLTTLKKPIKKILDSIPYIGKKRPGIPRKRKMTQRGRNPRPRLLQCAKDVSGLASLPFHKESHRYYITNKVLGVKRGFIPIFIYQDNQKYYETEVTKLQEKFKLGPLYIYEYQHNIIVIALKTMQRRQLHKVLNQSSSKTRHDFKKHGRIFAPFFISFLKKIPFTFTGHLSKGHSTFVEPKGKLKGDLCGWPKIELIKAIMRKNRE